MTIERVLRIRLRNRGRDSWTLEAGKSSDFIVNGAIRVPRRAVEQFYEDILNLNPDCDVETRGSILHISFRNVKLLPGEDSLDDSGKLVVHIPLSEIAGFGIEFRPVR